MKQLFKTRMRLMVCIFFIMLSTTGCWNRKELNELGIVGAVAVDQEADQVKLTYEIISHQRLENKQSDIKATSLFQSEGASIFDAIRNSTLTYDKKLYWPHLNALFFNEASSKEGLQQYLDLFNRDHDLREYVNLFVVKDGPAADIMDHEWKKGGIPSEYVEVMAENYVSNGKTVSVKLMDFIRAYYAEGIEPIVGSIEIVEKTNKKENQEDDEEEYMPLIEGIYAFEGDQLVGYLDGVQTRGYNFVTNKMESTIIVSESPDQQGVVSVEVLDASSQMDIHLNGEKYVGSVSVDIKGMLGEATGDVDISNIDVVKKIEQATSQAIKHEIEESIKKVQEYKTDIFGFGQLIHQQYPDEWRAIKENWNDQFATVKIDVEVNTYIEKAGKANKPLFFKEKE